MDYKRVSPISSLWILCSMMYSGKYLQRVGTMLIMNILHYSTVLSETQSIIVKSSSCVGLNVQTIQYANCLRYIFVLKCVNCLPVLTSELCRVVASNLTCFLSFVTMYCHYRWIKLIISRTLRSWADDDDVMVAKRRRTVSLCGVWVTESRRNRTEASYLDDESAQSSE